VKEKKRNKNKTQRKKKEEVEAFGQGRKEQCIYFGEGEYFSPLKVPRQCPFLLVKLRSGKTESWKMKKVR
jgi:hypothetical protein